MVRDGHGQEYRQEVVATMPSRLEGARHPCSVEPGPGAFCPPGRRCRHQLAGVAAESAGHVGRSRDHPLARQVQIIAMAQRPSGTQHPSGGHEHVPAAHPAATPAPPSQAQAPAPVPLGHASSATEPLPPSGAQAPRRKPAKPKPPKKAKPARARRKGTTANSRKAKRPASRRRRGGRR